MVHARIDGFLLDLVPRKAGLDAARGDWGDWWGQRVGLHLKCTRESIRYVMCYGPASRGTSVSQTGIDKATDLVSLEERRKYARPSVYETNTWTLFLENSFFVVMSVCIYRFLLRMSWVLVNSMKITIKIIIDRKISCTKENISGSLKF